MKTETRSSQFEFIRIIAMFMIVYHHLMVHGANNLGYHIPYIQSTTNEIGVFLNSFCIIGVNLFVLISGWFGIKHICKGIIKIVIDVILFGTLINIACTLYGQPFSVNTWLQDIHFKNYWFITAYLMLLLMAPIIEKSLENITFKTLTYWILLLSIVNLYFGFYLEMDKRFGYQYEHFIYLYYLARYLKISWEKKGTKWLEKWGGVLCIICTILLAAGFIITKNQKVINTESLRYFGYNNPLIILSAIGMFTWLAHFKFSNKWINLIATGCFGTYILHESQIIENLRNSFAHTFYVNHSYLGLLIMAIILYASCLIVSIIGENLNRKILRISIVKKICNKF